MRQTLTRFAILAVGLTACEPLSIPRDVMGNFEVQYADNLRVYLNDELVAEARAGEDPDIEWNGEIFKVSQLCGEEGAECPSDTYWGEVAVDQPWGDGYSLLNFVNLDAEHGQLGQRMGGTLEENGDLEMLAGLDLDGNDNCASIGVGTVTGRFVEQATAIDGGVITYEWAGGCRVAGIDLGATLRIETEYTAVRTGDFDLSSLDVEPEAPIDDEGDEVDPEDPDAGYERPEEAPTTGA